MATVTFGGCEVAPKLYAVVQVKGASVVARGLSDNAAISFAKLWQTQHGQTLVVDEIVMFASDDAILQSVGIADGVMQA